MKTIPELMNKQDLLAWARSKPPGKKYSYFNHPRCILTDYFYDNGHPTAVADPYNVDEILNGKRRRYDLPEGWNQAALGEDLGLNPEAEVQRTYGAFIERVEALVK